MEFSLNVSVPKYVCVSKHATESFLRVINQNRNLDVILVYTGNHTKEYLDILHQQILSQRTKSSDGDVHIYYLPAASSVEAHELDAYCSDFDETPVLIGIGGGSCIDVVKLVASRRKLMLYIYPTVLSSDCLTSPISVLQDGKKKKRIKSAIPNGIFIDTNITARAPRNLILSGIADLMSNASALLDLEMHREEHGELEFAILLSKAAVSHVLSLKQVGITKPRFQEALAQGLILSGLSMNFAGSSVTASGAEHLISHAIDYYGYGSATHGQQVYIGMLASDLLRSHFQQCAISNRVMKALRSFGLGTKVNELGVTMEELIKAIQLAPSLRPDRKSILNLATELSTSQLEKIIAPLFDEVTTVC